MAQPDRGWSSRPGDIVHARQGSQSPLNLNFQALACSGQPVADRNGRVPDHVVELDRPLTSLETARERISGLELPEGEREYLLALLERVPDQKTPDPVLHLDLPASERLDHDAQLSFALTLLRGGAPEDDPGEPGSQ